MNIWLASQLMNSLTTSYFGEICKRRANYVPLTIRILYKQQRETPAMRYGILHEKIARDKYSKYLKANCHPEASVAITGHYIDLKVYTLINTLLCMLTVL